MWAINWTGQKNLIKHLVFRICWFWEVERFSWSSLILTKFYWKPSYFLPGQPASLLASQASRVHLFKVAQWVQFLVLGLCLWSPFFHSDIFLPCVFCLSLKSLYIVFAHFIFLLCCFTLWCSTSILCCFFSPRHSHISSSDLSNPVLCEDAPMVPNWNLQEPCSLKCKHSALQSSRASLHM